MDTDQPVKDVVETLEDVTDADEICLRDVLVEFGTASFPPLLLAVALLLVSPLSGIPLFSSMAGVTIFLIAGQGMIGRDHIWVPERLARWRVDTTRSDAILARFHKAALWLDQRTSARWTMLVSPPASRALYGICALSGMCLPVLELVPLSSSLVGLSISLISTGLLARDGLFAVIGLFTLSLAALVPVLAVSAVLA